MRVSRTLLITMGMIGWLSHGSAVLGGGGGGCVPPCPPGAVMEDEPPCTSTNMNGGCSISGGSFGVLPLPGTLCGTSANTIDPFFFDADWYVMTATHSGPVRLSILSEFGGLVEVYPPSCVVAPVAGVELMPCGENVINVTLNPGAYYVAVRSGEYPGCGRRYQITTSEPGGISYQGRLELNGQPVDGFVDAAIRFYSSPTTGAEVVPYIDIGHLPVHDGLFSVDLSPDRFVDAPEELWMSIGISPLGAGTYTTLEPRQRVRRRRRAALRAAQTPWNGITGMPEGFADGVDDGGQWLDSSANIHFDEGNVGIGTASPASALHITRSAGSPTPGQGVHVGPDQFGVPRLELVGPVSYIDMSPDETQDFGARLRCTSQLGSTQLGLFGAKLGINTDQVASHIDMQLDGVVTADDQFGAADFMLRGAGAPRGMNIGVNYGSLGNDATMFIATTDGIQFIDRLSINSLGQIFGNFVQTSSRRFKTDVESLTGAIDTLMNLRPVRFNWDCTHGGGDDLGLIAEEVADVLPQAAAAGTNGSIDGISYGAVAAITIRAVQEQQEAIQQLREENESLRAEIEQIKRALLGDRK